MRLFIAALLVAISYAQTVTVTLGTPAKTGYFTPCTDDSICLTGSFCNEAIGATARYCAPCPASPEIGTASCTTASWVGESVRANCETRCTTPNANACTGPTTSTACGATGMFCNVVTAEGTGVCTACGVINTLPGTSTDEDLYQCQDWDFFSIGALLQCSIKCETLDRLSEPLQDVNDEITLQTVTRLSDLETGLACSTEGTPCCDKYYDVCEHTKNPSAEIPASMLFANYEMDGQCSTRACEIPDSFTDRNGITYGDGKCIVTILNEGLACLVDSKNRAGEDVQVAGICIEGACVVTKQIYTEDGSRETGHRCPDGNYIENVDEFPQCDETPLGIATTTGGFTGKKCSPASTGTSCRYVPRQAKDIFCTTATKQGPEVAVTDPQGNTGVINSVAIAETAYYDIFSDVQPLTTELGGFSQSGRCLLTTVSSNTDCPMRTSGFYTYRDMTITWLILDDTSPDEEGVTAVKLTVLYIPTVTKSLLPELTSSALTTGTVDCNYYLGDGNIFPCDGKYVTCPTLDPTIDPTMDPTKQPTTTTTTTTTATSHGDPIIWTFNDECYDLNQDGKYVATKSRRFDHHVNIGIYNDFMREIEVVNNKGETLLWINVNGEYESENYPYAFEVAEKECPEELEENECQDTYMSFRFDAQDFQYHVHILRHDYADAALKHGELGYHMDIYPTPYSTFEKAGNKDMYTGLYFENPLPEELEYCAGGSIRRT